MSCSSRRLRSVTSRPERTTPSILPCSSDRGLKLKRTRRHSPDLWRARISIEAKVCLPSMRFLYSDRRAGKSSGWVRRSEEHTSELQSLRHLVCRLLLEKKKKIKNM